MNTSAVKATLQASAVHELWESGFRTAECESFYEKVFDWILANVKLPEGARFLDVGCGIAQHSIRLARRGFPVTAIDFSVDRVAVARENVAHNGLASRIEVSNQDLVEGLSLSAQSFDGVLCWGVLMHIPENEKAMAELVRVTRVGGKIILAETNQYSLDALASLLAAGAKSMLGRSSIQRIAWGRYGMEYWTTTSAGELFIRHTRMGRLVSFFRDHGCSLRYRVSGQFTEKYTRYRHGIAAKLLHGFNSAWFSCGRLPYMACANVLIFERLAEVRGKRQGDQA